MRGRAVSALARNAFPVGLAAAAFTLAVGYPTSDPDAFWHLASGQWMLDHHAILRNDIFTATIAGQPYGLGEWLGEVVLALAFNAGGWAGLAVFRALLVGIAAFFLGRLSRRGGAPLIAALVVGGLALVVSKPHWTDRPAIFTFVLFPVLLELLYSARAGSRRALIAVPPIVLVWANLHGGYAIGVALVLAFTVEALLVRRRRDAGLFAIILIASVAGSFLDPETFGLGGSAGHVLSPPRIISEELPPDVLEASGFVFAGFVLATFAVALLAGGALLDAVLLVPLLWLALSAQRHLVYFVFAATPFIAAGAATLYARFRRPLQLRPLPDPVAATLALVLCAGALASAIGVPREPDVRRFPAGALSALRSGSGTLLNEYEWGGYLIHEVPERKVFIDGRLFPFQPGVLRDYGEAVGLRAHWKDVLAAYDVREVLLMPSRPLAVALREDGWTVRAEGALFVLLTKP